MGVVTVSGRYVVRTADRSSPWWFQQRATKGAPVDVGYTLTVVDLLCAR
jgi:hypothetical protein